jgi:carbonic anhydrase
MKRRPFLQTLGWGSATLLTASVGTLWHSQIAQAAEANAISDPIVEPDQALAFLLEGNRRFVRQTYQYPHHSTARLQETATAQHPFATILSCADSRTTAEILFDQGIGDLFDVRIAGNIVTPEVLGSLEYAAGLLSTPLIMVLGHERCGAVTAAVQDAPLPGHISTLVKAIKPSLTTEDKPLDKQVEQAVVANIRYQVKTIQRNSELIAQRIADRKLKIVGGRYDLDTGEVTVL